VSDDCGVVERDWGGDDDDEVPDNIDPEERVGKEREIDEVVWSGSAETELSGNGYSKRVEFVANGVPIICEEGEWNVRSGRVRALGIVSKGGWETGSMGYS